MSRQPERECISTTLENSAPSHLGVTTPRDSGTSQPSSTHKCECSRAPKNRLAQKSDAEHAEKIQEARRNHIQIAKCISRAKEKSSALLGRLPAIVGNTARGAEIQAIPIECMPLPLLTTNTATSCRQRREHSARCIKTSKTGRTHATATVDDEHGHVLIGHVCKERSDENRPQDPESTQSRRICAKFAHKAIGLYPQSNQVLRNQTPSLHDHRDVHDRRGTAPETPQTCTVCTVRDWRDSRNHGFPPLCR